MSAAQRRKRNRLNARKHSTGPRTNDGKNISRLNAVTHGLTAKTLTLPGENPNEVKSRAEYWHQTYQPQGPAEETLVDQLILAEVRLERIKKAENEIVDEQSRNSEIQFDVDQGLRLVKFQGMLRRDRSTAMLNLRSFGAGVSWLLGRWKTLESAFHAEQCWNDLGLVREAILLRSLYDEHVGGGYEFAHLALSCVEGHEKIPGLVNFLEKYHDDGVPCVGDSKNMREFMTSMASYVPDVCLSRAGVRKLSLSEARRTMRSWIERQIADLRELDRHFREADPKSRAGAKLRAMTLEDTPQNRLLLRYMKSAETTFDRAVKTLAKLQKERKKAAETEAETEAEEAHKADLRSEPNVVAQPHSKELVPGSYVTMGDRVYVVVETSDGNVILSPVEATIEPKASEVAAPSENGV